MKKIPSYVTEIEARKFVRKAFLKKIIEARKLEALRLSILENRRKKDTLLEDVTDTNVAPRTGSSSATTSNDSSPIPLPGDVSDAIKDAAEAAKEGMESVLDVAVNFESNALGYYLTVANTELKPMVYELSDHTTTPVGPEQAVKLYADFYAFVAADDTPGLARTKTLIAAYAEDNENISEFLGSTFTPTDPVNLAGYLLIPFTGGGSAAVAAGYQALKKGSTEVGENIVRNTVRKKIQGRIARDMADDALDDAGQGIVGQLRRDARTDAVDDIAGEIDSAAGRVRIGGEPTTKFGKAGGLQPDLAGTSKFNPANWRLGRTLSREEFDVLEDAVTGPDNILATVMDDIIEASLRPGDTVKNADDFFKALLTDENLEKIFKPIISKKRRAKTIQLNKLRKTLKENKAFKRITQRYYKRVRELDDELLNSASVFDRVLPEEVVKWSSRGLPNKAILMMSRAATMPAAIAGAAGRSTRRLATWITPDWIENFHRIFKGPVSGGRRGVPSLMGGGITDESAQRMARQLTEEFVNTESFYDDLVQKLAGRRTVRSGIDSSTGRVVEDVVGWDILDDVFLDAVADNADKLAIRLKTVFIENPELLSGSLDDFIKITDDVIEMSPKMVKDLLGADFDKIARDAGQDGATKITIKKSSFPDPAGWDEVKEVAQAGADLIRREQDHVKHMLKLEKEMISDIKDISARSAAGRMVKGLFIYHTIEDVTGWADVGGAIGLGEKESNPFLKLDTPDEFDVSVAFGEDQEAAVAVQEHRANVARIEEEKIAVQAQLDNDLEAIFAAIEATEGMTDEEAAQWAAENSLMVQALSDQSEELLAPETTDSAELPDQVDLGLDEETMNALEELKEMSGLSYEEIVTFDGNLAQDIASFFERWDQQTKAYQTADLAGGEDALKSRLYDYFTSNAGVKEMSTDISRINFADWGVTEFAAKAIGWVLDIGGLTDISDVGDRTVKIDGDEVEMSGAILDELVRTVRKAVDSIGRFKTSDAAGMSSTDIKKKALDILSAPALNKGDITSLEGWGKEQAVFLQNQVNKSKTEGIVAKLNFDKMDRAWNLFLEASATGLSEQAAEAVKNLKINESASLDNASKLNEDQIRKLIRKVLQESKKSKKKRLVENEEAEQSSESDQREESGTELYPPPEVAAAAAARAEENRGPRREDFLKMQGGLYALWEKDKVALKTPLGKLKGINKVDPENHEDILTWWFANVSKWFYHGPVNVVWEDGATEEIQPARESDQPLTGIDYGLALLIYDKTSKSWQRSKVVAKTRLQTRDVASIRPYHQTWSLVRTGNVKLASLVKPAPIVPGKDGVLYNQWLVSSGRGGAKTFSEWDFNPDSVKSIWQAATGGANKEAFANTITERISDYLSQTIDISEIQARPNLYIMPVVFAYWASDTQAGWDKVLSAQTGQDDIADKKKALFNDIKSKFSGPALQSDPFEPGIAMGLKEKASLIAPLYADPENVGMAATAVFEGPWGSLAKKVESVIRNAGFATTPLPDEIIPDDVEVGVSETGDREDTSDDTEEDGDQNPLDMEFGIKDPSPEKAREAFIELLRNRTAYKDMVVIAKPSKGSRAVNNYMLEFSMAAYLVKHGLEGRLEQLAPNFWEGFYTTFQRRKGAKVNTTIGDFGNLPAVFNEILVHAASRGEGIMSDPEVKALVSGSGNDWRTISTGLRALGYTQYLDEKYLDYQESDIFGWASFVRDLANGVNVRPAGPRTIPESVRKRKVITSKAFKRKK